MKNKWCLATLVAITGLALGLPAGAAVPVAIFTEIPAHPTAKVPGLTADFDEFDRPYRSPDGSMWIISASSNLATTEDEVIIVGSGPTSFGATTVVREGTAAGWAPGENVGLIDRNMGINDSGHYTFATNTDGPTTGDEYIVRWNGGFNAIAQEGTAVPGVPDELFGTSLDSPHILNTGMVGYRAPSTAGLLPSDQDDFLFMGASIVAQTGVTIPSGQAGGATETWGTFDLQDYYTSADGSSYLAQGDLNGATTGDDVIVVNGQVVLQEDSTAPGLSSPITTLTEAAMMSNGDWFARGSNDDSQDWIVRNGVTIAKSGDEVPGTGGTEHYDDTLFSSTFFHMVGNNNGDYVFGATTDFADPEFDAVLIFNGTDVVARQGDAVDIDGNGLLDDDAYIDIFNNDDGFLTDDLVLYFTADLRNGLGEGIGQAFLTLIVPEPSSLLLFAMAGLTLWRRRR